ncbi:MAG: helix-turn-helix domain-containing protein [Acidimicrobiia bacterium]|nr:helix-turn-helix domain-containing protein [Acidimicrobiia bacterium]
MRLGLRYDFPLTGSTILPVKTCDAPMDDVRVLAPAAAVEVGLGPIRASILDALAEAGSATTIAAAIGSTCQKVNYLLNALEARGLVEAAFEREWGGITERFVRRAARRFVVAPDVLHSEAIDPEEQADRLSAEYLIAVNAKAIELGAITAGADPSDHRATQQSHQRRSRRHLPSSSEDPPPPSRQLAGQHA